MTTQTFQQQQAPLPAGFWRRAAANLVDQVVLSLLNLAVLFPVIWQAARGSLDLLAWAGSLQRHAPVIHGGVFLSTLAYYVLLEWSPWQATVGKRIVGIQVTGPTGNRMSLGRSIGRTLAKLLSVLTFGIGFLLAAFTREKQALHDLVAGAYVVRFRSLSLWKYILVWVFCVACWLGAFLFLGVAVWRQSRCGPLPTAADPAGRSAPAFVAETLPVPEAGPEPMTARDYRTALKEEAVQFALAGWSAAGPAVGRVTDLHRLAEAPPTFAVRFRLPAVPNAGPGRGAVRAVIDRVRDQWGRDVYDRPGATVPELVGRLHLTPAGEASHLIGTRDVRLLASGGGPPSRPRAVEGRLIWELPVGHEEVTLAGERIGITTAHQGMSIRLLEMTRKRVCLKYVGPLAGYFGVVAYSSTNHPLAPEAIVRKAGFQDGTGIMEIYLSYEFPEAPEWLATVIADRVLRREYPFTLTCDR